MSNPSPDPRSPGYLGCAAVFSLASGALLMFILPWLRFEVPWWVLVADVAFSALLLFLAFVVPRR